MPATTSEALAQIGVWWRERTDLHDGIPGKPVHSTMKEAMTQLDTWWRERIELAHLPARKPATPAQHRRHHYRDYLVSPTGVRLPALNLLSMRAYTVPPPLRQELINCFRGSLPSIRTCSSERPEWMTASGFARDL